MLLDYHFCLKHPKFREEKEWRLVKFVDVWNLKTIAQDDRQRIDELLIAAQLNGAESSAMYTLAHSSMNAESLEVIKFRSATSGLTPYIEQTLLGLSNGLSYRLPITSIIVGPSAFADGQVEATGLLTSLKFDMPQVTVERSNIPLR